MPRHHLTVESWVTASRVIHAAHAAGVPAIGYANKASKPPRFTETGAAAVITRMIDLTTALRSV